MEDAGVVVCVQRRDARLRAQLDAPVRLRAVRSIAEGLDAGILDVDSDPCRYDHTLAVHEDVEMRVDVMRESLLALRLQPRGNGEAQRVFRGSPGSRAVRRLRRGVDQGRCGRGLKQQAGQDGDAQDENARGAASGGFADRADPSVIPQVVDSHVIPRLSCESLDVASDLCRTAQSRESLDSNGGRGQAVRAGIRHQAPSHRSCAHARMKPAHAPTWHTSGTNDPGRWRTGTAEPCGMLGRKPLRGLGSRRRRSPCVAARRAHRTALRSFRSGVRIPPGPSLEFSCWRGLRRGALVGRFAKWPGNRR